VIDIQKEQLITLAAATKLVPPRRGGAPCSFSCAFRWTSKGVRAADGSLVKLESLRVGGTICTSVAALQRFFERLGHRPDSEEAPTLRTPRQRQRAADQAAKQLEAMGV
jgi:hypothetical protein